MVQVFISDLKIEAAWSSETPANISVIRDHFQGDNASVASDVRTQISQTNLLCKKKTL
jgi:hypothetical protein